MGEGTLDLDLEGCAPKQRLWTREYDSSIVPYDLGFWTNL
jgi:hypothetical protein